MNNSEVGQSTSVKPHFFYGYTIVIICLIVNMFTLGIFFSVGVFFKPMLNDFGWTRTITSGPISLSWIVGGLVAITMGGLNDRFGPRVVVMICGLFFGIGYLLMSQISSTWQLYLYYGLLIGAGTSIPIPLMSTVTRWFVKRRTIMNGIVVTGSGIGGLIVPLFANWLILNHGWRTSYIILGSILLVVVLTAAQFLKRDPSQIKQMPYGADKVAEEKSRVNARGLSFRKAFNTRQFWLIFALFFCFSWGANLTIVHLVPHITDLEISATIAATVLVTMNGAGIVGRIGLGSLGERIGNKRVFMMTFIILAVSFSGFMFIRELWLFYLFAVIFGLAWGSGLTQQSPLVATIFGLSSHGLIFGFICLGHTMGAAIGTLIGGYIFDNTGSYQLTFLICGVISIIGLILVLSLTPVKESMRRVRRVIHQ